jgi:hypothetical protein
MVQMVDSMHYNKSHKNCASSYDSKMYPTVVSNSSMAEQKNSRLDNIRTQVQCPAWAWPGIQGTRSGRPGLSRPCRAYLLQSRRATGHAILALLQVLYMNQINSMYFLRYFMYRLNRRHVIKQRNGYSAV